LPAAAWVTALDGPADANLTVQDAINRRIGTEHLIQFAKENRHLQFVYLTPQDVSMLNKDMKVEEGFINVQKLANAKR
jgi:hypothetical protein